MYFCGKCGHEHRVGSEIGQQHVRYIVRSSGGEEWERSPREKIAVTREVVAEWKLEGAALQIRHNTASSTFSIYLATSEGVFLEVEGGIPSKAAAVEKGMIFMQKHDGIEAIKTWIKGK